jgi:TPR repeat protein
MNMGAPAALVLVVLAIALTPVAVVAGSFERGVDAYSSGDYAAALRLWRPLAERGEADSQHNLGVVYRDGEGVARDHAEAARWFKLAAGQGNADSQTSLGILYYDGLGVARNHVEAAKWFRRAADQGDAIAQNNLSVMYAFGDGVPRDLLKTHMWFNLAASRFPPGEDRDKALRARDMTAAQMTPEQVAEAHKLAREWKPRGERPK